jgi:hypothetical protein
MQADIGKGTDRGENLRLGKYFCVRADPNLKILRPQPFGDEGCLDRDRRL